MNILIVGSGGREHALAWKAAQSSSVQQVFVAPGNAGTAQEAKVTNVDIAVADNAALARFAQDNDIDLTIIGPELPLVSGISDHFKAEGLACFGPSKAAAQLEGSKAYSKDFMHRHGIPTARYATFKNVTAAKDYVRCHEYPVVIKADGLAAGKGVVIAQNEHQALLTLDSMLQDQAFGDAGQCVVIEEFIAGEEASFIALIAGDQILPLASSQDHKARDDGDQGPNTGGMGAYSPAPVVSFDVHQHIMQQVIEPTVHGLLADGNPYYGFLYAGLMIKPDGDLRVLEYNCRLGDPETQVILPRLQSDLPELCLAALNNSLNEKEILWDSRPSVGVVMAAGGYPGQYKCGEIVQGLDNPTPDGVKIFHAGTVLQNEHVLTAGGRVLCVTALGDDVQRAQQQAYQYVNAISWNNVYFRKDIAYRAIAR